MKPMSPIGQTGPASLCDAMDARLKRLESGAYREAGTCGTCGVSMRHECREPVPTSRVKRDALFATVVDLILLVALPLLLVLILFLILLVMILSLVDLIFKTRILR
jgi:hypothetical protein